MEEPDHSVGCRVYVIINFANPIAIGLAKLFSIQLLEGKNFQEFKKNSGTYDGERAIGV